MSDENIASLMSEQCSAGNRDFSQIVLEKANLEKAFLTQINFSNSQLNSSNFEQADLSNASFQESSLIQVNFSRANLRETNFVKANLSNANLTGAIIIGANFAHANLTGANLSLTKLLAVNIPDNSQNINTLEIPKFNQVSFFGANLTGTFFLGVDLSSANLQGAVYSDKTNFPPKFDPVAVGMVHVKKLPTFSLEELLTRFNNLLDQSNRFLGPTITLKYFNAARPQSLWLNQFQINANQQINFVGNGLGLVSSEQLDYFQQWIDAFTKYCSKIIKNFPDES